jgi:hypothetical protein
VEKEVEYIFRGERKGGDTMKYEKPEWEIIEIQMLDIVTASKTNGSEYGEGGSEDDDYFG